MKQLMEQTSVEEAQKKVLLRCCTAAKAVDPGAEVILYGSRARGDAATPLAGRIIAELRLARAGGCGA